MKVLNVAEKPSAAKSISHILSNNNLNSRNGFSKYNRIFDFKYTVNNTNWEMCFTSVTGHINKLNFKEPYTKWSSCQPLDLFSAPVEKIVERGKAPLVRTLKSEAKKCSKLVLWLDCDREGENICYEVIKVCLESNNKLEVLRARFSALIPRDIHFAAQNLVAPQESLSQAVEARMEVDLRIGNAFTRFFTKRLQENYKDLANKVISYGPCQTPTLGLVVKQHLRVVDFVAEKFWFIKLCLKQLTQEVSFKWKRHRLFDRMAAFVLFELCYEKPSAHITAVTKKPAVRYKPLPLTTVEMQKLSAQYLKLPSKRTMDVAEQLYQRGLISYPRTETNIFNPKTDFLALITPHANSPQWGEFARKLAAGLFSEPRRGSSDDKAHPPIHPLKHVLEFKNNDEKRLYELISRHFLAAVSRNAVGEQVTVTAKVGREMFFANGTVVKEKNFYEVYIYKKWSDFLLPEFTQGQTFQPSVLEMAESETTAPQLLSEARLIGLMDQNGIGTDATIAQHISKIQERSYAKRNAQNLFEPTSLGVAFIQSFERTEDERIAKLARPEVRAEMERGIARIASRETTRAQFLSETISDMKSRFEAIVRKGPVIDQTMSSFFQRVGEGSSGATLNFSRCGKCSQKMELYKMVANKKYLLICRTCKSHLNIFVNGQLSVKAPEFFCPLCKFQVLVVKAKQKRGAHAERKLNSFYNICPYCFSNPPRRHGEQGGSGAINSDVMRCFQCTFADCLLSDKTTPVRVCRRCGGRMVVKKIKDSLFALSCKSYPRCRNTYWLKGAKSVVVKEDECGRCGKDGRGVKLVEINFDVGVVETFVPMHYKGCLFCDQILLDAFSNQREVKQWSNQREKSGRKTGSRKKVKRAVGRSSGSQTGLCMNCREFGHLSADCSKRSRNN